MDASPGSYIPPNARYEPNFDAIQQPRDYSQAPRMDRTGGSSSSWGTDQSFQSLNSAATPQSSLYVDSPDPEYGTAPPQTSSDFDQKFRSPSTLPTSPTSPTGPQAIKVPLLDIEKDGDPRIKPDIYYVFKVGKKESFYELRPGHLVTPNFPKRKKVECRMDETGKKIHVCEEPFCTAKPFTRHYDLERHFKSRHDETHEENTVCDYKKCKHTKPFRKDHGREHYREYHMEDLVKRSDRHIEKFLSRRAKYVKTAWYRCIKCLNRVTVKYHGYQCPKCEHACETERVQMRKQLAPEEAQEDEGGINVLGTVSNCGQCENLWVRRQSDPDQWDPCLSCQPGRSAA